MFTYIVKDTSVHLLFLVYAPFQSFIKDLLRNLHLLIHSIYRHLWDVYVVPGSSCREGEIGRSNKSYTASGEFQDNDNIASIYVCVYVLRLSFLETIVNSYCWWLNNYTYGFCILTTSSLPNTEQNRNSWILKSGNSIEMCICICV